MSRCRKAFVVRVCVLLANHVGAWKPSPWMKVLSRMGNLTQPVGPEEAKVASAFEPHHFAFCDSLRWANCTRAISNSWS